nr:protein TMED8 [Misgurnus anguillicaudatus]XP_055028628.1 protein TMED8 [Misgurnus anguillicaudatus]XP_055028629.1 protein TMED8 [Misgurnus anguillicaudatus]
MEKLETSELQSRLSSLSVSSFPGITSKNCESDSLNRLQSTDLSRTVIQPDNQTKMDDNSNNRESLQSSEETRASHGKAGEEGSLESTASDGTSHSGEKKG